MLESGAYDLLTVTMNVLVVSKQNQPKTFEFSHQSGKAYASPAAKHELSNYDCLVTPESTPGARDGRFGRLAPADEQLDRLELRPAVARTVGIEPQRL